MWPYPWTHVGTPSHLGHMDRVAATMPSQAHAGAAQEAPDIGQWEGQDVPLVRPSSCDVKGGILSSRRYLPTYLKASQDNRHSVPTYIPIPGPTLSVAGGGGGSNTTHALLSPDPETLPIGEVSRPATGGFL